MHSILRFVVPAALGGLACLGAAQAQNVTVKAGAIYYQTHAKTNGVTGIGIPPGADATVGNATTLLLAFEYALSPHVGVELVLGVPPKIEAKAAGSVAFLGDVLSARIVAPTLLFNYHFLAPGSALRPYVGVGVNYTRFIDAQTPYGWDVNLSDSTGLAAHVGLDWAFNKQWGLFASIGASQVKSNLTATGAAVLRSTIDFRPVTYTLGASYRF